jgi:hypothetical protein
MGYDFPTYSLEQYADEKTDISTRKQVPELDTKDYVAFHDTWIGDFAKRASSKLFEMQEREYVFVNKKNGFPRRITCENVILSKDAYVNMVCIARISYLAERFPQDSTAKYPYTIEFNFPGTEIDNASEIGRTIADVITGFLDRSSLKKN